MHKNKIRVELRYCRLLGITCPIPRKLRNIILLHLSNKTNGLNSVKRYCLATILSSIPDSNNLRSQLCVNQSCNYETKSWSTLSDSVLFYFMINEGIYFQRTI